MDSNKYSNSIIYKIVSKDISITECYIGSTCDFKERKRQHKYSCNNENSKNYNLKVYIFMRENGGWDNFEMIEIKKYECCSKAELHLEERTQMELYGGKLNTIIPSRTTKEWREDNKEYYKEWCENNREKIKEQCKEYRQNNREKIKERQNQKFKCDCGGKYQYSTKVRHNKTNKHKSYINNKLF